MVGVRGDVDVLQRERASSTTGYSNELICITDIPQKREFSAGSALISDVPLFRGHSENVNVECRTVEVGQGAAMCLVPSWRACSCSHLHTHTHTDAHIQYQAEEEFSIFPWFHPHPSPPVLSPSRSSDPPHVERHRVLQEQRR